MKKLLLVVIAVLGIAFTGNAQDRAIGIHGGYGWELSYQQPISPGSLTTLDADLGVWGHAFAISATVNNYNEIESNFTWFYGVGLGISTYLSKGWNYVAPALVGRIGLQYAFQEIPLNISLDWKPMFGICIGDEKGFYGNGMYGGGIGIRYRF